MPTAPLFSPIHRLIRVIVLSSKIPVTGRVLKEGVAGRPSQQAVTAVFGKSGYALSWVARADRLGITPEELCDRFKADPNKVKKLWAELTAENEKETTAQ